LVLVHLIALHDGAGSNNPTGILGNYDKIPFAPYFVFKDLITIFIFIAILSIFVFFMPNVLGDSENYVMANPMQTPPAIVPEWYLLPFYAILRSIPNKLLGVIAMFSALLILITLPFTDLSRSRGIQFRPLSKIAFYVFVGNFLILMQLGAKHVESPFIELGQISTIIYFAYFLVAVPVLSLLENSLIELQTKNNNLGLNKKNSILSIPSILNTNIKKSKLGIVYMCIVAIIYSNINTLSCDVPTPWGLYFQDSATPQMEALEELHDNIFFYLAIILFGVGWILLSIIRTYSHEKSPISRKYVRHGTLIELIWTITPAIILILIAFPSFKLLYLMDEITDPAMVVIAEGHQWYWSYQYPDFLSSDDETIEFDSYLVPESDLEEGNLRMLEVDNRVILPELTHVRFIVTAADVIHSFACPALGIKCDAYPGRLNQMSVLVNREGTFYGQCSEICGILHTSMPIVIESVSIEKFLAWLEEQ
jgi:cytochrome c oxidase subunit 2